MRIAITGANGFVGRTLIGLLLEDPAQPDIRALVRDPVRAAAELPAGVADVRRADVADPPSLSGAFAGIDAVVHTVAIPTERHGSFERTNALGTRAVVGEAERAGIRKLVHLSAIGASPESPYPFLRTKGEGQAAVEGSAVPHVVLRPSVLFGPGDDFFHRLRFSLRFPDVGVAYGARCARGYLTLARNASMRLNVKLPVGSGPVVTWVNGRRVGHSLHGGSVSFPLAGRAGHAADWAVTRGKVLRSAC